MPTNLKEGVKMLKISQKNIFFLFLVVAILHGCNNTPEPPPQHEVKIVEALLQDIKVLERSFGLAIIAATPADRDRGNPMSIADTKHNLAMVEREIEFIDQCKVIDADLTRCKTELVRFTDTQTSIQWATAWKFLVKAHREFTNFTDSTLWSALVPERETNLVIDGLAKIGAFIDQ